jgi:sensor histidine kinase YesM
MFPGGPPNDRPPGPPNGPPFGGFVMRELRKFIFQFLIVAVFALMLRIKDLWKQAEKEKLNAELSYLKAQINPHFLFNTLNSIYSLAIEKSDYTATAVVKLSEMMRFVTTEANNDFVSLEKELNYIGSYIDLQKIRFGNTIKLKYSVEGDGIGKKIAPLILIPFVENAFKHGVNPEENSYIQISIDIKENILHLLVFNNKVNIRIQNEERTEQGIENTKNRLQHLYPSKHLLVIDDDKSAFSVSLTIDLK